MNKNELIKMLDDLGAVFRDSNEGEQIAMILAEDGLTMENVMLVAPLRVIFRIYNLGLVNGTLLEMKRKEWEQWRDIKEQ